MRFASTAHKRTEESVRPSTNSRNMLSPRPARHGTPWPADEDAVVWATLGHYPRTAVGHLSTANGVGQLVRALAIKYQRTESGIKSRIKYRDEHGLGSTPTSAPAAISPITGRDATRSSVGWQSWPVVSSGAWGLVYVSSAGRFGYYDDEEDEDECIVYFGAPLSGDGPHMYPRCALLQPPFDGQYTSMGASPAEERFAASQAAPGTSMFALQVAMMPAAFNAAAMSSPRGRGGNSNLATLEMFRSGNSVAQIAEARSLTATTIEKHLIDLYTQGLCPEAPQRLGLTPAIRDEIRSINASLMGEDFGKLKPIKERCNHDYGLIRLALV